MLGTSREVNRNIDEGRHMILCNFVPAVDSSDPAVPSTPERGCGNHAQQIVTDLEARLVYGCHNCGRLWVQLELGIWDEVEEVTYRKWVISKIHLERLISGAKTVKQDVRFLCTLPAEAIQYRHNPNANGAKCETIVVDAEQEQLDRLGITLEELGTLLNMKVALVAA